MTEQQLLDALITEIKNRHPSFSVKYKDESRFQMLHGLLTYPFNVEFMGRYTTTLGSTVYFPNRAEVEGDPMGYAKTLAHERVHIWDGEKRWLRYNAGYASPQIWALPLLAVYVVLGSWMPVAAFFGAMTLGYLLMWLTMKITEKKSVAIRRVPFFVMASLGSLAYVGGAVWLSGWWALLAVGALVPLGPWRSPWRTKWEQRGYGMSMAMNYWRHGRVQPYTMDWISSAFTTMAYYRMDPNRERVMSALRATVARLENGDVFKGPEAEPFVRVHDVLMAGGFVKSEVASA